MRHHPRWFSVHRWLGLVLGLWFALVGLTGSVLVFEETIDAWLNPSLLVAREPGPALPLQAIAERARELGHVERIRPPAAAGEVYRLLVRTQPERRVGVQRVEAMLDPASGALLGTRSAEAMGLSPPLLMQTLYEFHRNVLLGNAGSNIVGIAGTLLFISALSGLVLAWPTHGAQWRRLLKVNWRASFTRIAFDTHRAAGALTAVLLVLATLTGLTLVYVNYVRDAVNLFSKVESFPTIPWRTTTGEPAGLDTLVQAVHAQHPDALIREIRVPAGQLSGYQFFLQRPGDAYRLGDTIVWVHPVSAEILVERSDRTRTAGETFMHWLFPLHSGTAFGTAGMVAMCVVGAAPLLLVLTGLWVWVRKRPGERLAAERQRQRAHPPALATADVTAQVPAHGKAHGKANSASHAASRAVTPDG
jgi:uncharacterized iron-regulated membrane protein